MAAIMAQASPSIPTRSHAEPLVGVPVVYMAIVAGFLLWLGWSAPLGGRIVLGWMANQGPWSQYYAAVSTFVVSMVAWHGYGALQNIMDKRPEGPWGRFKMHRRDTITYVL